MEKWLAIIAMHFFSHALVGVYTLASECDGLAKHRRKFTREMQSIVGTSAHAQGHHEKKL